MLRQRKRHRAQRPGTLPVLCAAVGVVIVVVASVLLLAGGSGSSAGGSAVVRGLARQPVTSASGSAVGDRGAVAPSLRAGESSRSDSGRSLPGRSADPAQVSAARAAAMALAAPVGEDGTELAPDGSESPGRRTTTAPADPVGGADGADGGPGAAPAGAGLSGDGAGGLPSPPAEQPVTGAVPSAAPSPNLPSSWSVLIGEVVDRTNDERRTAHCPPLTVDVRLAAAAQAHSADMAKANYFGHNSRDGSTPFDRITAAGFSFSIAAENIGAGQRTVADVMTMWMNSPEHRANILTCSLTRIGVGYAMGGSYGTYWTQDFGTL